MPDNVRSEQYPQPAPFIGRKSSGISSRKHHEKRRKAIPILGFAVFAFDGPFERSLTPFGKRCPAFASVTLIACGCEIFDGVNAPRRKRLDMVDDRAEQIEQRRAVARPMGMTYASGLL